MTAARSLAALGFFLLLLIALLMASNHVAARLAFDHGVNVPTAVAVRSLGTAVAVGALLALQRVSLRLRRRELRGLLLIGLLVSVQSLLLYSAVARLPVALALLVFNTFPLMAALWARVLYRHRPERAVLVAMPLILLGLVLALDVLGAASGLGAAAQWGRIGAGVAFAVGAAAAFALMMVVTQHEIARIDGRVRSAITMGVVGVLAFAVTQAQGGMYLPQSATGVWGVVMLTLLYGTAFVVMYTLLPRLGVVGSSPILNIEPVLAMIMAWALLGQHIAPIQIVGALIVVGTVMVLGLRKR